MRKIYEISEQEYKQVEEIRKANYTKTLNKKLRVIALRFQGYKNVEIAEIIQYTPNYVATLLRRFKEKGLQEYCKNNYKGANHVYAAVEPKTGENFFLVMPNCNTDCMNVFINELSSDVILLNRFSKCIHIRFRIKVVLICSINI